MSFKKVADHFIHSFYLKPENTDILRNFCGVNNANISWLQEQLQIDINIRSFKVIIRAKTSDNLHKIAELIQNLYSRVSEKTLLSIEELQYLLNDLYDTVDTAPKPIQLKYVKVSPRGATQKSYVEQIDNNHVVFGIGPAGTGKTYLAVVKAVQALEQAVVDRIVLVRPAIEAGERLGFLPGDLEQKVNPYLRPLFDGLYQVLGDAMVENLMEKRKIEIAPLAFMRGRTLANSFVIFDESQNSTSEQMKMLLTRIGHNSKVVITGDLTQIDLPKHQVSGLKIAETILQDIKGITFCYFKQRDVVRHPIVRKVISAYNNVD